MIELLTGYDAFLWVETWSNPALDVFFRLVTDLGYPFFYYLAVAPLFWIVDRQRALVLFLLLLLAALVNTEAKNFFATARPDPAIVRVLDQRPIQGGSPSFPSGHAQIALVFWGYLAVWARRRWATAAAVAIVLAISFSRLYLGAHFPIDILGGLLLGGVLFAAVPWLDRWGEADLVSPAAARLLAAVIAIALMLRASDPALVLVYGCLLGLIILLSLPQAEISPSSGRQTASIVLAGVGLQIASAAMLGQFSGAPHYGVGPGFRVAALWLIALWAYPHLVAVVLARRQAASARQ